MRKLKLMADYQCFPLWEKISGGVVDVAPSSLPISTELIAALNNWAARYDETLVLDDPARSGFKSEYEKAQFLDSGRSLFKALQAQLGAEFEISYKETGSD